MHLSYRFFDADNHYYEPEDCYTRCIDPRWRKQTLQLVLQPDGSRKPMVGERPYTYLPNPFLHFGRPGQMRAFAAGAKTGSLDPESATERFPEYMEPKARLAMMDRQGLEAAVLYPSIAITTLPIFWHDADLLRESNRAFNRWLLEDWGFAHAGRLFTAPCISLWEPDDAAAELEWVLARGARVVCINPGPQNGRSPADPALDGFWARAEESGVLVALHSADVGYAQLYSAAWGDPPNPPVFEQSLWQWVCCWQPRAVADTLVSMLHYNLFERFPKLRVLSIENGGDWLPSLCWNVDRAVHWAASGPWPCGKLREKPSAYLRRNVWVSPWPDEDLGAIVRCMGAERVLFGSDFPHPEGCAEPKEFANALSDFSPREVKLIMRENLEGLLAR